jgi:hypothetical protein
LLPGCARFTKPTNTALQWVWRDATMDLIFDVEQTKDGEPVGNLTSSFVLGLFCLIFSGSAGATSPSMAVSQGMGDTVRSNPHDSGSVYAAPGMVWVDGRFDVTGGGQLGSGGEHTIQVAAHDSQTSPVGLGLQWFRNSQDLSPTNAELPGWRRKGTSFTNEILSSVLAATIGGGGVHHLLGVGLNVRYFNRTSTLNGSEHSVNVTPGVSGVMADQLYLSFAVENAIPLGFDGAPLGVGTGTRWQPTDRFGLAFDTLTDLSAVDVGVGFTPMLGAEFRVANVVPLRAGWTHNGVTGRQLLTAGIGASNESFALNYSVQMDLDQEESVSHWHGVSLRISM